MQSLNALPEEKQKTHQLVAMRKSDIAYEKEMLTLQLELAKLQKYIGESGQKLLIIFE
jgi:polyphosphate kinase 2 (PPK2 family)